MEGFNKEIHSDYVYLEHFCKTEEVTEETVFKIIASYDKRYEGNPFHYEYVEGLLSNIGTDLKSIKILNAVIKRLKKKSDKKLKDKYYYDLGNTIFAKACVELERCSNKIEFLINSEAFLESKKYFSIVSSSDLENYPSAITNISNILDKYGRNYESIYSYDKILRINPEFGMALGNKAIALDYYQRLVPNKSYTVYYHILQLLNRALLDPRLDEIGGEIALAHFKSEKDRIDSFLKENRYKYKKKRIPRKVVKYERFVMKENLYLNYDFGYYYDDISLTDNFFPQLIEKIGDKKSKVANFISEKTFNTFKIFNQLIEDYTTVRHLFFTNRKMTKIEKKINYIYLYDFSVHSRFHGNLKHIFAVLYNCLDKVAHFVRYYFMNQTIDTEEPIYFNWLTSPEFKNLIIEQENYQLLALYNFALDFCEGHSYSKFRFYRNKITHSVLIVRDIMFTDEETGNNVIHEDELINIVKEMFVLVKSSLLYLICSINNYKNDNELYGKLEAVMEHTIYDGLDNDIRY